MKITHIVRQFYPNTGGLENFVYALASEQRKLGHEVEIATLNRIFTDPGVVLPAEDSYDGIPVYRTPFLGSRRYPIAPGVRRFGGDSDIRHVHAIDFIYDYLGLENLVRRTPLVATTHGGFFHTRNYHRVKQVWLRTMTRASTLGYDAVAACSPNDARMLAPAAEGRLVLIENGVDILKFADAGSKTPRKALFALGRFGHGKRLDRLVNTLAALRAQDPEWRLHICGVDYDLTRAEVQAMIDRAGQTGAATIHFDKNNVELLDVIAECSFYVSASRYEGFGLAVSEAMSAGLIGLLQADNTVFQDFAEQHGQPRLIDFETAPQAAAAVAAAYEWLARDVAGARAEARRIASGYAWDVVAARYVGLYEDILARRGQLVAETPTPDVA